MAVYKNCPGWHGKISESTTKTPQPQTYPFSNDKGEQQSPRTTSVGIAPASHQYFIFSQITLLLVIQYKSPLPLNYFLLQVDLWLVYKVIHFEHCRISALHINLVIKVFHSITLLHPPVRGVARGDGKPSSRSFSVARYHGARGIYPASGGLPHL